MSIIKRYIFCCASIILYCLALYVEVNGATYYVSKGGSGTAPYDTVAKAATTIATITALDLNGDDIVEICAATTGGSETFTERILVSSNDAGASGHPLIIRGRSGDTVTIDGTGNNGAFQIATATNDWITLSNLTLTGGTVSQVYVTSDNTGLTLDNISVTGGASSVTSTANTTSWTISDSTFSGVSGIHISLAGSSKAHTSTTMENVTTSGGTTGVYMVGAASPTFTDMTMSGGTKGIWLNTASGTLTASGLNISGMTTGASPGTNYGLYIVSSSLSNDSTVTDSIFSGNSAHGVRLQGASGISFTDCIFTGNEDGFRADSSSNSLTITTSTASSNIGDGFSTDSTYSITYDRCTATSNGTALTAASGDGFTGHQTDRNITLKYCQAYGNTNTGAAYTGTTHGFIYNCTFWDNGTAAQGDRGGLWLNNSAVNSTTGKSWTVYNNIIGNSYNVELWLAAASAALIGTDLLLDSNIYYDSTNTTGTNEFSLDGGATKTSWATYNGSYESDSSFTNPLVISSSNLSVSATSPAINAGYTVTGIHDQASPATDVVGSLVVTKPDIGAYESGGSGLWIDTIAGSASNVGTKESALSSPDDYSFTGYNLRSGATVYLRGTASAIATTSLSDSSGYTATCWPGQSCIWSTTGYIPIQSDNKFTIIRGR